MRKMEPKLVVKEQQMNQLSKQCDPLAGVLPSNSNVERCKSKIIWDGESTFLFKIYPRCGCVDMYEYSSPGKGKLQHGYLKEVFQVDLSSGDQVVNQQLKQFVMDLK